MSFAEAASLDTVIEPGVIQLNSVKHQVVMPGRYGLYRTARLVAIDQPFRVPDVLLHGSERLAISPVNLSSRLFM